MGSLKNFLLSPLFILGGIALLIWNEDRAKDRNLTLLLAAKEVREMSAESPSPDLLDKLVKISGQTVVSDTVKDPVFGVIAKAIKFNRVVEKFHKSEGGADHWIISLGDNKMGVSCESLYPSSVKIAKIFLTRAFVPPAREDMWVDLSDTGAPWPSDYVAHGHYLYTGDPNKPEVGDVRVHFTIAPPGIYTVMGRYGEGMVLEPYSFPQGDIALLMKGAQSSAEMIHAAKKSNDKKTWIFRVGGILMITLGFYGLLSLGGLLTVIPVLNMVTGPLLGAIAVLLGLSVGLVVIGISWIVLRPLLGLGLLGAAGLCLALLLLIKGKNKEISHGH